VFAGPPLLDQDLLDQCLKQIGVDTPIHRHRAAESSPARGRDFQTFRNSRKYANGSSNQGL
jgi:hypothetical protein